METKSTSVSMPPEDDLSEVKKPTSLLIAQFFLFPMIIIAICVGIFLLFGYLTYEQKTAKEYLRDVQSGYELCCRWQSAYELSNMISSQKEKLRGTDFVDELVRVYQTSHDQDPRVRRYLALTMGHLGDPRAIPALIEGLKDSQVDNQVFNLWALGSIGDKSAVPAIQEKLKGEDAAVRRTAVYVLGALKDPRAVHDLQVALNDTSDDVVWNAAMALAQLNDAAGAEVLIKLTDRNYIEQLSGMTADQKSQLLINAVKSLGILKFEAAHDKIIELSRNDPDPAVRNASIEALANF